MKNDFYSQLIKLSIAEILIQSGFEKVTLSSLSTLADILIYYIMHITRKAYNRPFITKRHLLARLCSREMSELVSYMNISKRVYDSTNSVVHTLLEEIRSVSDDKEEVVEHNVAENRSVSKTNGCGSVSDTLDTFISRCKEMASSGTEHGSVPGLLAVLITEIERTGRYTRKNVPPFRMERCSNRLSIDSKKYAEMLEWRRERGESEMVTDELCCYGRRVVKKE